MTSLMGNHQKPGFMFYYGKIRVKSGPLQCFINSADLWDNIHSRRKKTKMKTFVMLSVVFLLLILETSSRPADDKSDEKSSEECGDSDECGSDEDPSSGEEFKTSPEKMLQLEPREPSASVTYSITSYISDKCQK